MQAAPVDIGDVLAGKFRVERILGIGGMGVVVVATHLQLDKLVATKFMLDVPSNGSEISARFLREAKAAARLHSQNIARVLDVGTMESGAPYMVMEYLDGQDLEVLIEKRAAAGLGPLPPSEAVDYVMQACLGMAEAHSHGFVHRDLKPPNLFLTQGSDGLPLIKILDFGIAKAAFDGIATKTQAIMGSPFYMSPEQWQGARDVDERGDIWAMGAILQYLVSGKPPFEGDTLPMLFASIASKEPLRLTSPTSAIPPQLQEIVSRCLQKNPNDRPQSIAELALLLAPLGSGHAEEYARKAARIATAGPGRTGKHDGFAELHANRPAEISHRSPTGARLDPSTTLSRNSGQIASAPAPTVTSVTGVPKKRTWVPLAGVAAASIAALGFFVISSSDSNTAGAKATTAAAPLAAAPLETEIPTPPSPVPSEPEMARVTFSTEPEGAELRVNGMLRGVSPLEIEVEVGSELLLRFDLPGHEFLEEAFVVKSDTPRVNFPLVAIASKTATAETAKKRSSTRKERDRTKARATRSDTQKPEVSEPKAPVIKSTKPVNETIRSSSDRRN